MSTSGGCPSDGCNNNIVRTGYMKKVKTGRRKWFILRKETSEAQARLEYYDSEKKYQSGVAPRKVILLKTCFNINQISDPKHKHVIALYTKDECLTLAIDDEGEAEDWFKDLLVMQQGEDLPEGQIPRPTFAHVWEVLLVNRGLGTPDLIGNYRLCLREKTLSLVRKERDSPQIELNLSSIRSCGSLQKYVFFEIGRSCSYGPGELWMETEDQHIAQNVHSTVYHWMTKNSNKEELGPKGRIRSSSATETTKPNSYKKQYTKNHIFSQDHSNIETTAVPSHGIQNTIGLASGRERCDSMPSRARTASEGNHPIPMFPSNRTHLAPHRPCSIHRDLGNGSPVGSPISPPSAGASTDSAGSSYSLVDENEDLDSNHGRYGHSLTPDEAIAEEDCDSLCVPYGISPNTGNYLPMAPPSSDDGYVDMSPKGRHSNITPAASLSSVTSGTPSTDMRFAEYQLDKVMSYFPPSSDDESRPIRAYSVGSRPDNCKYKKHLMDVQGLAESRRDRAASVGSKTKKGPVRVLPPHGHYPHTNPKSSSAPILSNSRIPGSTSSVGSEMDDLMELDFTNVKKRSLDGYLEMKPSPRPGVVMQMKPPTTTPSGYVEMKPGVTLSGPYLEMKPGTSPGRTSTTECTCNNDNRTQLQNNSRSNDYLDMNAKNSKRPVLTNNNNNNYNNYGNYHDYSDMNHHQQHHNHHQPPTSSIKRSYSQISPSNSYFKSSGGSPSSMNYMDMHYGNNRIRNDSDRSSNKSGSNNEGYVEMSLGRGHHRQSSLDSAQIRKENDYAAMSAVGVAQPPKRNDGKMNKKDNHRSMPITISKQQQSNGYSSNNSGRCGNSGNSPKSSNNLQLHLTNTTTSPNSTFPSSANSNSSSSRGRKNNNNSNSSRRDSRDSSSSSVTTPSNSSTIFPLSLNSPSSPVKPLKTPERSAPSLLFNSLYKRIRGKSGGSAQEEYAVMDFQKKMAEPGDYVNVTPSSRTPNEEDYAEMMPTSEVVLPPPTTPDSSAALSLLTLTEASSRGFKPISEVAPRSGNNIINNNSSSPPAKYAVGDAKRSDSLNGTESSSSISSVSRTSRPGSASSDLCSSTSTLVGSRPDSVNGDSLLSSSSAMRPSSASILHYANLDLQPIDDDGSAAVGAGGSGDSSSPDAKSPRSRNINNNCGESSSAAPEVGFSYAQIDFKKSDASAASDGGKTVNKN